MKLRNPSAEIYVPDGLEGEAALARTTHLAIAAHQDDIEIMAIDGILQCYRQPDKWFTGVVVTNGSGSPRSGLYQNYSDEEMMEARVIEQKQAAFVGGYAAQMLLAYPSAVVKDANATEPIEDIKDILEVTRPQIVYTHNLADKHLTHVSVVVRVISALRALPKSLRPQKLFGCEVWRDLGWMLDEEKVVFDCSQQTNLQEALMGVFDSQISGGKRYDLATMGRRLANATYFASHEIDAATGLAYAMDLTPLIINTDLDIKGFVQGYIERFAQDVRKLIDSVS